MPAGDRADVYIDSYTGPVNTTSQQTAPANRPIVSNTSPREIFDDASAAAYIGGITGRTIRNWRTHRGLPFIRITARTIRIRRADLDDWLARHRIAMIQ